MSAQFYVFGLDTDETVVFDKEVLGGKGAGLAEMTKMGLPVPPGLTFPTKYTKIYEQDDTIVSDELAPTAQKFAEEVLKIKFGHVPLLSVRSGAPVSMPGMMDTILNVGMNSSNVMEWADRIGARAAWDSYRRLIQMLGTTAYGIEDKVFEDCLSKHKKMSEVETDQELPASTMETIAQEFELLFQAHAGTIFPQSLYTQLEAAIGAVFKSWHNDRAKHYRKMNGIPEDMGTAVNVQAMVFGNMGDDSGTGVLFTRNPLTGERVIMGEFLQNAQGEDVVAGIRTPMNFHEMAEIWPALYHSLTDFCETLENHFQDMQDIEFTVQKSQIFLLQCRSGKRTAKAAFRIAHDLVQEKVINKSTALDRVSGKQYLLAHTDSINYTKSGKSLAQGLPASSGPAVGRAAFSSQSALSFVANGTPAILVSVETTPDDIAGMDASVGILTSTGGATSHAAVVARSMDKPCVVGMGDLKISGNEATVNGKKITEGMEISICGDKGLLWDKPVEIMEGKTTPEIQKLLMAAYQKADCLIKSSYLIPGLQVWFFAAKWQRASEEELDSLCMAIAGTKDKVVIDLTPESDFIGQSDEILWNLFGQAAPISDSTDKFLEKLAEYLSPDKANVSFANPTKKQADFLEVHNFSIVREATTVKDLVDSDMVFISPDFVKKVLGGKSILNKLKKTLDFQSVPRAMYESELAFENFGGG